MELSCVWRDIAVADDLLSYDGVRVVLPGLERSDARCNKADCIFLFDDRDGIRLRRSSSLAA